MNYLKIIEELGFVFYETEIIEAKDTQFDGTVLDSYVNEETNHLILIWVNDFFSCRNVTTGENTCILDFNNIMAFYFNNLVNAI